MIPPPRSPPLAILVLYCLVYLSYQFRSRAVRQSKHYRRILQTRLAWLEDIERSISPPNDNSWHHSQVSSDGTITINVFINYLPNWVQPATVRLLANGNTISRRPNLRSNDEKKLKGVRADCCWCCCCCRSCGSCLNHTLQHHNIKCSCMHKSKVRFIVKNQVLLVLCIPMMPMLTMSCHVCVADDVSRPN